MKIIINKSIEFCCVDMWLCMRNGFISIPESTIDNLSTYIKKLRIEYCPYCGTEIKIYTK